MDDVEFVVAVAEGGEDNPVAVGGPGGTEIVAAVGEFDQAGAIYVDDVDIAVALRSAIEGETCAIGRPSVASAHVIEVGHLADIRTVRVHDEELACASP